MTNEDIDKSVFDNWNKHPVTKQIMTMMSSYYDCLKDEIVNRIIHNEEDIYQLLFLKGRFSAVATFLKISFQDVEESIKEEKENAK